jgi:hypothetical protein
LYSVAGANRVKAAFMTDKDNLEKYLSNKKLNLANPFDISAYLSTAS